MLDSKFGYELAVPAAADMVDVGNLSQELLDMLIGSQEVNTLCLLALRVNSGPDGPDSSRLKLVYFGTDIIMDKQLSAKR